MNPLDRSFLESLGDDNGWENLLEAREESLVLGSSRHPHEIGVLALSHGWRLVFHSEMLEQSLRFHRGIPATNAVIVATPGELGQILYDAAQLAMALPTHPLERFQKAVREENIPDGPGATEAQRLEKVRIGQGIYRDSLVRYWGGACAVTGLSVPGLLRASHAKPWATCGSDAERLDVFNGFLLAVHLDGLFDQGFVTFDPRGGGVVSSSLDPETLRILGLDHGFQLRWMDPSHERYLAWHRDHVFEKVREDQEDAKLG